VTTERTLTESNLEDLRDHLDGFAEYGDIEGLIDDVPDLKRLLAEREQLVRDVQWLSSELGTEHWRECDAVGCYLCDGHTEIQERWQHAPVLGLDQDGEAPHADGAWLCQCGKVNSGPLGECTHSYQDGGENHG